MKVERAIFQSEEVKVEFHIVEWTPAFASQLIELTAWFQHQGGHVQILGGALTPGMEGSGASLCAPLVRFNC